MTSTEDIGKEEKTNMTVTMEGDNTTNARYDTGKMLTTKHGTKAWENINE